MIPWSKAMSPNSCMSLHPSYQIWFTCRFLNFDIIILKIGNTNSGSYQKMRQKTVITKLLRSVTEVYYKVRKVLQGMTDCYYKVHQVLQSSTVITKWDITPLFKITIRLTVEVKTQVLVKRVINLWLCSPSLLVIPK